MTFDGEQRQVVVDETRDGVVEMRHHLVTGLHRVQRPSVDVFDCLGQQRLPVRVLATHDHRNFLSPLRGDLVSVTRLHEDRSVIRVADVWQDDRPLIPILEIGVDLVQDGVFSWLSLKINRYDPKTICGSAGLTTPPPRTYFRQCLQCDFLNFSKK